MEYLITKLESRYDPERDVNPEWPNINWAEHDLLCICKSLMADVAELKKRVSELEATQDAASYRGQ